MMFFKEALKIENAEYHLPGIVYAAEESHLNVYAYKDRELTDNTELYAAPFFNVTGASVCLGSAKIEKPKDLTYAKLLEYWERKFWLTEFFPSGRQREPDQIKPRAGDKGGQGQGFQPGRTETVEQFET